MAPRPHAGWRPQVLRQRREALGLTLDEVAEAVRNLAGIDFRPPEATFQSVGRHERGEVFPGPRYRRAYCVVYGRSEAELGFRAGLPASTSAGSVGASVASVLDRSAAYPDDLATAAEVLPVLWETDAAGRAADLRPEPAVWSAAPLAWTLHATAPARTHAEGHHSATWPPRSVGQVTAGHVDALRATVRSFAALDFQFGGGHARHALARYLHCDVPALLGGRYGDRVGRDLRSAVAEAALTVGWMAYDAGFHGLAQRNFVQALRFAQAADDTPLAGEVLGRMSHQAAFLGRLDDAARIARTAALATARSATPTLTAEFFAMEARAHARHGDSAASDAALSAAEKAFERRSGDRDDPAWADYFDESELNAEIAHCYRDLRRPRLAVDAAVRSLGLARGQSPRSDFFTAMVLADAHFGQDDPEPACETAERAIADGDHIRSARCVHYVREFRGCLVRFTGSPTVTDFAERVAERRLWRMAAS